MVVAQYTNYVLDKKNTRFNYCRSTIFNELSNLENGINTVKFLSFKSCQL